MTMGLWEMRGKLHTGHRASCSRRRAAKDKQVTQAVALACVAADLIPQFSGKAGRKLKAISNRGLAGRIGVHWPESVSRLLPKVDQRVVGISRTQNGHTFELRLPQRQEKRYGPRSFEPAPPAECIAKYPELADLFHERLSGGSDYRKVPAFVADPNLPLRRSERLVLAFFFAWELFLQRKGGQVWMSGRVQVTQEEIGRWTGLHRDTVRAAIRRLADGEWTDRKGVTHKGFGIVKIIGKGGAYFLRGKQIEVKKGEPVPEGAVWRQQEPNEYVGIADWIETDRQRYDRVMEPIRATQEHWAKLMDEVYDAAVAECKRDNRQQKTLHAMCRGRMERAGVPKRLIEQAIPPPPE
jgi:hypothetical protein